MAKGMKTTSHKRKLGGRNAKSVPMKKNVIKCNVVKGCNSPATYDFMTMDLDLKMTHKHGCDKCLKELQKDYLTIDGTGDEVVVKHT